MGVHPTVSGRDPLKDTACEALDHGVVPRRACGSEGRRISAGGCVVGPKNLRRNYRSEVDRMHKSLAGLLALTGLLAGSLGSAAAADIGPKSDVAAVRAAEHQK